MLPRKPHECNFLCYSISLHERFFLRLSINCKFLYFIKVRVFSDGTDLNEPVERDALLIELKSSFELSQTNKIF